MERALLGVGGGVGAAGGAGTALDVGMLDVVMRPTLDEEMIDV